MNPYRIIGDGLSLLALFGTLFAVWVAMP